MTEGVIPQADPGLQYRRHRAEIDEAVRRVLESGWYILGPEVEAFEREFAAACGTAHAIGVGSGTDALCLAVWALDLGPEDEVLVPAHTAVATVAAVELAGAKPVLVDVDECYTMDPAAAAAAITDRTRAIVPVHLYGNPADLESLGALAERHGLALVEDCAQAHGAEWCGKHVGGIGTLGCFSFYPTKNLGALGDAGAVVTDDAALADRVRLLRQYGWRERQTSDLRGDNSRLDELQAAILRVRLGRLEADTEERRALARVLSDALEDVLPVPLERPGGRHVYHLYVVEVDARDHFRLALETAGVGSGVHYARPIHGHGAYSRLGSIGQFPRAERACQRVVSLPLYPGLDAECVERIGAAVTAALCPTPG